LSRRSGRRECSKAWFLNGPSPSHPAGPPPSGSACAEPGPYGADGTFGIFLVGESPVTGIFVVGGSLAPRILVVGASSATRTFVVGGSLATRILVVCGCLETGIFVVVGSGFPSGTWRLTGRTITASVSTNPIANDRANSHQCMWFTGQRLSTWRSPLQPPSPRRKQADTTTTGSRNPCWILLS
jgi:hypothetical protein